MTNSESITTVNQNQVVPFVFSGREIRTMTIDDEPWFIAIDVAKALGYEKPNNATNAHCKKVNKIRYPETGQPVNVSPYAKGDVPC